MTSLNMSQWSYKACVIIYLLGCPDFDTLNALAKPKSANFRTPFFVINTFAAFISLCKIYAKHNQRMLNQIIWRPTLLL
jgi:hypothetical protein